MNSLLRSIGSYLTTKQQQISNYEKNQLTVQKTGVESKERLEEITVRELKGRIEDLWKNLELDYNEFFTKRMEFEEFRDMRRLEITDLYHDKENPPEEVGEKISHEIAKLKTKYYITCEKVQENIIDKI